MYECTNNSITLAFDSCFNQLQTVYSYNTTQASKGNIDLTGVNTTQYGKRSVKYAGGILWNNLSAELKILELHDIRSLELPCFMYECTNNTITPAFDSYFNQLQTVYSYNTRQTSKVNIYLTVVNTT